MTPDIRPQLDSWKGPRDDKNRPIVPLRNSTEPARILCTDAATGQPIVGIVKCEREDEIYQWDASGMFQPAGKIESNLDILLPQPLTGCHNPANLCQSDLDKLPQGKGKWRLLNPDEIKPIRSQRSHVGDQRIAKWSKGQWDTTGWWGSAPEYTFATDYTCAQLAALDSGYTLHEGDACPVDGETVVQVWLGFKTIGEGAASTWEWDRSQSKDGPIIAYRVIREAADPYAELKTAHAAGKVIQYLCGEKWSDLDKPTWCEPVRLYRIKPTPLTAEKVREMLGDILRWVEVQS